MPRPPGARVRSTLASKTLQRAALPAGVSTTSYPLPATKRLVAGGQRPKLSCCRARAAARQ
eukprot:1913213-Prymnesium_polylepis.1